MSVTIRVVAVAALTLMIMAPRPQTASASERIVLQFGVSRVAQQTAPTNEKRYHQRLKIERTKKPAEQYLRSAAPSDPEHAQR